MLLPLTRDLVQNLCVILAHQRILFLSLISVNSSPSFLSNVLALPQPQNVRKKSATNIRGACEGCDKKVWSTGMRSVVNSPLAGPDIDNFSVNQWSQPLRSLPIYSSYPIISCIKRNSFLKDVRDDNGSRARAIVILTQYELWAWRN